jgi:hypothetical protein
MFATPATIASYGQIWVTARRVHDDSLVDGENQPVRSLPTAREALEIKRHERRENKLPTIGRKPLFADYCEVYFQKAKVQRKRPGTVENERQATARWRDFLGHVRIDRIATPAISAYIDKRLHEHTGDFK